MNELISIIIPVYNVEHYLDNCLESVVNQSYDNLEIILIDDGSTDSSGSICDRWAEEDNRIRVIHQKNKGSSAARNNGLSKCNGKMIGFVDADDWVEKEMYLCLANRLNETGSDIVMCGYYDYPNGLNNPIKKGIYEQKKCDYNIAAWLTQINNGYFTSIWNKLFKRDSIIQNGEIIQMDTALDYGEDEVWLLTVMANCNQYSCVSAPLYNWRPREGSITRTDFLTKKQMSLLQSKQQALQLLPKEKSIQSMAKGNVFNDCHILKVIAYCSKDKCNYNTIKDFLRKYRKFWIKSRNIRPVRKAKVSLLDALMFMKMPTKIVQKISDKR